MRVLFAKPHREAISAAAASPPHYQWRRLMRFRRQPSRLSGPSRVRLTSRRSQIAMDGMPSYTAPAALISQSGCSTPQRAPWGTCLALVLLAVSASVAVTLLQATRGTTMSSGTSSGHLIFIPFKSPLVNCLRLLEMMSILGAGTLALLKDGLRCFSILARFTLVSCALVACLWTAIFTPTMTLTKLILGDNSPLIWFMCVAIFIGTQPSVIKHLEKGIGLVAWLMVPPVLYLLARVKYHSRFDGPNPQVAYLGIAVWFGAFHLLAVPKGAWIWTALRSIPVLACCVLAVINQGRGWVVQSVLALGLLAVRPLFLHEPKAAFRVTRNVMLAATTLAAIWILLARNHPLAAEGFLNRLTVDSRSAQLQDFFSQVSFFELATGKGPDAQYRTSGDRLGYGYIDNQFLWMAFKGGMVIAIGYMLLVIVPGVRLLFRAKNETDYAAACTLFIWGLGLAGLSTYLNVGFNAQNYLALILAGYCHFRLAPLALGAPRP